MTNVAKQIKHFVVCRIRSKPTSKVKNQDLRTITGAFKSIPNAVLQSEYTVARIHCQLGLISVNIQ
jgi:hypothetical protein